MKTYDVPFAQTILANTNLLKEEIINSKGLFLYFLEQKKIFPPIDILIDSVSPYSLLFLKSHYDIDNLKPEQTKVLDQYLLSDENFNKKYNPVNTTTYSLEELLSDIKNRKDVDNVKKSKLKLKFEHFKEHKETLLKLLKSPHELHANELLLNQIFNKTTPQEVLSLGEDFLINNPFIFNLNSNFLKNSELKTIYKKAVENYHMVYSDSHKKSEINNFLNYNFEQDEKPFLETLLKNTYYVNYDKLINIQGATQLITRWEFFEKFDDENLSDFSSEDIKNNKELIRKVWLENFKEKKYFKWNDFSKHSISFSDFKEVVDEAFLKELIIYSKGFLFDKIDSDVQEQKEKAVYLNFTATKILAKDPDMAQYIDLHSVLKSFFHTEEYNRNFLTQEYATDAEHALKNSAKAYIHSNNVFQTTDYSPFLRSEALASLLHELTEPSINSLYFFIQIYNKLSDSKSFKHPKSEELKPFIGAIASKLDKDQVKKIVDYFNYPLSDEFMPKDSLVDKQDYAYNALQFAHENFDNISIDTQKFLIYIDENFREHILKNNYNIMSPEISQHEDVFTDILGRINSSHHMLLPFVKQYIENNKDAVLQNYFSLIAQHPIRQALITLNTHDIESNNYEQLVPALKQQQQLKNIQSEAYNIKKQSKGYSPYNTEKNKEEKEISTQLKDLEKKIESLNSVLSHNFKVDTISKLLQDKKYEEATLFINKNSNYIYLAYEYIKDLPFADIISGLENKSLVKFITENKKNTGNEYLGQQPHVKFNTSYSQEQNKILATELLSLLNFQYESENKDKVLHVLNYFEYEVKDFAKQFVIENDPVSMFYSYEYRPTNERQGKHIKEPFTNEEIIQGLHNLEKNAGNVFNMHDTNIQYDSMLTANYYHRENEYLDLLKSLETEPVLYLFCCYSNIYNDFINFNKKDKDFTYKNTSEAKIAYVYENLNLEVIKEGISQLLSDVNNELAKPDVTLKGINDFVWRTEDSTYDFDSKQDILFHQMTEKESASFIKTIWDKAPLYFMSRNRLGAIKDVQEFIVDNFEYFYNENTIENLFLNLNHFSTNSVSFNTEKDSYNDYDHKLHQIFDVTCNYLLDNKQSNEIDTLVYISQQIKFNENLPYKKKIKETEAIVAYHFAHEEQFTKFIKAGKQKYLLEEKIPIKVEKEVLKRKKI